MVLKWIKWSALGKSSGRHDTHVQPQCKYKHANPHARVGQRQRAVTWKTEDGDREDIPQLTGSNFQQDVSCRWVG